MLRSRLDNPYLKLCQGKSTLRSRKALCLYTLDDLLSKKRKPYAAKPKNLKEKDPILKGVKDSGDQIDIDIMLQPDKDKKRRVVPLKLKSRQMRVKCLCYILDL